MNVHDEPLHAEAVEGLFLSTVDNPRGACLSPIGAFLGQQARALATYPLV